MFWIQIGNLIECDNQKTQINTSTPNGVCSLSVVQTPYSQF